jgi:hypothetical protein
LELGHHRGESAEHNCLLTTVSEYRPMQRAARGTSSQLL